LCLTSWCTRSCFRPPDLSSVTTSRQGTLTSGRGLSCRNQASSISSDFFPPSVVCCRSCSSVTGASGSRQCSPCPYPSSSVLLCRRAEHRQVRLLLSLLALPAPICASPVPLHAQLKSRSSNSCDWILAFGVVSIKQ
jgi:hypothetical protein